MAIGTVPAFALLKFLDAVGNPVAGGSVTVYLAGTTTPTNSWQDRALTILNTNPVSLNSSGECVMWLDPTLNYKLLLKDSNGATVPGYPQDNVLGTGDVSKTALSASNGSTLVGFQQIGTGAGPRDSQSKQRESFSITDYYANGVSGALVDPTGTIDSTAGIQAAATFAINNGFKSLYIPTGTYKVSSTINLGRLRVYGDGDGSRLIPTISDGSPVLSFAAGSNFFVIQGVRIDSNISLSSFSSGAINAQNCTGIKIISTGTFSARYALRDVLVRGCKVGYDINGFIGTLDNVWSSVCETGIVGTAMNALRMHLRFEECRKDFAITASNGLHFDQLLSEGDVLQSGLSSSTIDGCNGVVFNAPYFEQVRNVPFISFGATTQCRAITIKGISMGTADNAGSNYDIFPLAFDQVDGLHIGGYFSTGSHHNFYSVTTNTKNIVDQSIAQSSISTWGPHDNSKNLSVVRNHFPNPIFDLWFRGWPNVSLTRAAMSQETTLVRRGQNAVRLTLSAGQANGQIAWTFTDSYLGVKLRGKTVTLYKWIWIPNTSDYDPNQGAAQPVQPSISIFTDGTGGGTTQSGTHHTVRGAWNLFKIAANIPSDCTRIDAITGMAMNSGTSAGTEYLVIDSVFLVEGNGQDIAVRNGWITDSDLNQCIGLGGRAIIRSDTMPIDPDQIYEVGDEVVKWTTAASTSDGWKCVLAGAGGTANQFKTKPALGA